ncbi:MAG: PQQ-dependent sugar dehydrogenase [Flavobacteriaceae bacterium]
MKKITLSLLALLITTITYSQEVIIDLFANGFSNPTDLQNAGDDRLFVTEKAGEIKILNTNGTINPTPFLDINSIVIDPGGSYDERGLLGLAFHPDYTNNGYFYVYYINNSGDTQVSRFSVDAGNPDIADPASEFQLLSVSQPFTNHNGGCMQFGPDGYLYIGMGDGGSAGDPGDRAQNLNLLLGKMLRIDINNTQGGNNYAVPADNPFVGDPNALDEIWSYGLRNPWRFSFDFQTQELWIGDVGQGTIEEVDRETAGDSGLNYGWRCYEGSQTYNTSGCPNQSELTFPVAEYTHSGGNCSITGGYVYRGSIYSDILGLYFYADFCSGEIGTIDNANNQINHGSYSGSWVSFGEDNSNELYLLDNFGSIYKIRGGILSNPDFNESDITLYPNPVSDSLKISVKNTTIKNVIVYDLKGKAVITKVNLTNSEEIIKVNSLAAGIYMMKITSEKGSTIIKKIIIK